MTANQEIRLAEKSAGIRQWQIAEALGISESVLCRKLRHELPAEEKSRILDTITNMNKTIGTEE